MTIDEARRTSFDEEAELYDAARPSYAGPLFDEVITRSRIPRNGRILEVGAGTGKATVPFARCGYSMVALEPGEKLAKVLRRNVAAFPKVAIEISTFEAWTGADGTFDLVISAQALHWVDPKVRYRKAHAALRAGGALALIRNEQESLEPSLRAELDDAYARYFRGVPNLAARDVDARRRELAAEIERSGLFGPVHSALFPWKARYTAREYLALLSTHSDHAVLDPRSKKGLFDAVAAAIEHHGGVLEFPYVSLALIASRKAP
ncbi:MAG: class I SAM-dependent methyltransferase [Myxococcales bacterium]